ncbi:MAG: lipoprotein insertase outer membrane protein LolB [Saezia sp.]
MKKTFIYQPLLLCFYCLSALLLIHLTACSAPSQLRATPASMYFSGRLSLVQDPDPFALDPQAQQGQTWTAHFELAGSPENGTLHLYTPVGTTVAKVTWQSGQAIVETSNDIQYFNSLEELTSRHFQQSIPVAALFDWLKGTPTKQNIEGWRVDLSKSERGIIKADRLDPTPQVHLKIVVDERNDQIPPSKP